MELCLLKLSLLCIICIQCIQGAQNLLHTAYEWRDIDFQFESEAAKEMAIVTQTFQQPNLVPYGLEVYRNRVFLTLPRWKEGVPASLAYFDMNANKTMTPLLLPYPSWEAHDLSNDKNPELVSPFRVRADRCGRLWVLDSRIAGVLENTRLYGPAQILVYDLHNDDLLRRHIFPVSNMKEGSFFANLVIEDDDCQNTYAYAADLGNPGLVVYSWLTLESWRVQHNFFHPEPTAGNFSINGLGFQNDDGLYGLALSKGHGGKAMLYFHPFSSTMEFSVPTSILHNKTGGNYHEFQIVGERGQNAQAGASFYDKETDVIFYAMPNLNALACWQSTNGVYNFKSQNIIYESGTEFVFPNDITIDEQQNLWILTNRLHEFLYGETTSSGIKYRILTAPVREVIKNTPCALKTKPLTDFVHKVDKAIGSVINATTIRSFSTSLQINNSIYIFSLILVLLKISFL